MRYFGTDGIRGQIDNGLNSELAYSIGRAIGSIIIDNNMTPKVVVGKDTRYSGDVISYSLCCGLMEYGVECMMLGIVPTACVSYITTRTPAAYGIMITASHNSWDMNGIKIFNKLGYKCDEAEEKLIENLIDNPMTPKSDIKGKISNRRDLVEKYITGIIKLIDTDLSNYSIALDLANGANYSIAPQIFRKLNANIVPISTESDGYSINKDCGAQYIDRIVEETIKHKCDFGFAFDGDADRLRVVTRDGTALDGDDILYLLALYLKSEDRLNSLTVVGTILSNSGLEASLNNQGINFVRTDVGDKNVIEALRDYRYCLGGESSGHICLHDYNTTCDALFNSLFLLKIVAEGKIDIKESLAQLIKKPSIAINIPTSQLFRDNYYNNDFALVLQKKVSQICKGSKSIIRPSGTEAVFRVNIEGDSIDKIKSQSEKVKKYIITLDRKINNR